MKTFPHLLLTGWLAFLLVASSVRADPPAGSSEAERITNAREDVQQAKSALAALQKTLADPNGEYAKAEAAFESLDRKMKQTRLDAAKAAQEGKADEAARLEAMANRMHEAWQLAKDRFDLAIRERKITQDALLGLQDRIASGQALLDRLEGRAPAPGLMPVSGAAPSKPAASNTAAEVAARPALPGMPGLPSAPAAREAKPAAAPGPADPRLQPTTDDDRAVRKARAALAARLAEQNDADALLHTAKDRIKAAEKSLKAVEQMAQLEKETLALTEKELAHLDEILRTRPPAEPEKRKTLADRKADVERRRAEARDRGGRLADRTAALTHDLKDLHDEKSAAEEADAAAHAAAESADAELAALLNPLAPRNLLRWITKHGPNLLCILGGMIVLYFAVRLFSRQIVRFVAATTRRGSEEDKENRAHTLVGVFRYAAGIGVFGGGIVMLLDEAGVPVVPLMGGAAVIGLAVAFGAQNLIKDYFGGFMMLMEDQYSVNDVIQIGDVSGTVELITLRVTVLRDLKGIRHFIPHGSVTGVSNLTHGWSRAVFEVPVGLGEDVDRVIALLRDLARGLRADPVLGKHILEEPEMLGVDSLSSSGVVIKFLLKTRPLQQWAIKRELLRRIKNRFDESGIESPFSHHAAVA